MGGGGEGRERREEEWCMVYGTRVAELWSGGREGGKEGKRGRGEEGGREGGREREEGGGKGKEGKGEEERGKERKGEKSSNGPIPLIEMNVSVHFLETKHTITLREHHPTQKLHKGETKLSPCLPQICLTDSNHSHLFWSACTPHAGKELASMMQHSSKRSSGQQRSPYNTGSHRLRRIFAAGFFQPVC